LSTLGGVYSIGFSEALQTGTNVAVNFSVNRSSSNSVFSTFNPLYTGSLQYLFTQHLSKGFGRTNNTSQIRIAQNNQKISETQFEKQLMDLVAQAERSYWDLVFAGEDIKIKQRSMDLAQKTLSDNQIQVRIGTLAPIDLVQAESDLANRRVQYVTSTYTEIQTQDQVKKLITSQSDPGLVLAKLIPSQGVRSPEAADVMPVEAAIKVALENRAAQGDNARAMTDERTAEQRISSQAQQIALEVRNALTAVEMNKAKIDATTTARELAERRLDAEQKKFNLGASTVRFVLQ